MKIDFDFFGTVMIPTFLTVVLTLISVSFVVSATSATQQEECAGGLIAFLLLLLCIFIFLLGLFDFRCFEKISGGILAFFLVCGIIIPIILGNKFGECYGFLVLNFLVMCGGFFLMSR